MEFTLTLTKIMYFKSIKQMRFLNTKETIRQAFRSGIIEDAQLLIYAIDARNELSHDYSGEVFKKHELEIRGSIYQAIEKVYRFFLSISKN